MSRTSHVPAASHQPPHQSLSQPAPNALALLPLGVFLVLFIGAGLALGAAGTEMAFYQLSPTVAILPAIALSLVLREKDMATAARPGGLTRRVNIFLAGAGEINIVTMCVIYLLAGGFASVASAIGGVESTVNLGLSLVPHRLVLPGLFAISAFVATAMGTSMGTIAAVGPIAAGVAAQTGMDAALLMGAVVGGAMFGDNLSMISDTTIAATRTQGCDMRDKFRMNFAIALPAALLAVAVFWMAGDTGRAAAPGDYRLVTVLPYVAILAMALSGMNVFAVLFAGIVMAGGVGMAVVDGYTPLKFAQDIYKGFTGMHEILVLSMLMGGLGELIRYQGGVAWLLAAVRRFTDRSGRQGGAAIRTGEAGISGLVAVADLCTANNTVAIILTGGMAREIAATSGVDPRRSASLLDIFSCVVQGLAPHAAQVLLAGSIAGISPVAVLSANYYCLLLGAAGVLAILTGLPRAPRTARPEYT